MTLWLSLHLVDPIASGATKPAVPGIDFSRQIRPILSDNCFACHGPDENTRKGKLRLDRKEDAFKGGKSGVLCIVPGKPEESELFKRLTTHDEDDLMPPPKSKKVLSSVQIDLVKRWITEGASWQSHWAFEKPLAATPPENKGRRWAGNEIDQFVLARLEKESLKPALPADKPTLVRRVSLDLTGLPPTIDEVDAFLNDKTAGAYEKLVDRLLESNRYGENMARYWMDAVRYADSHGYHIDSQRDIWPYRDWVINAFNKNMPFDQFTTEQLAGDLLPNPTQEQKIASGYVRCNMSTGEGGVIEAEYQAKYTFDRTETTGTIWMGLTLTCSRCHSHKYDPISHREYYGLYSLFNSLNEPVMDDNKPNPDPFLQLPAPEQKARQDELKGFISEEVKKSEQPMPVLDAAQTAWQSEWNRRLSDGWSGLVPSSAHSAQTNGASLKVQADHSILASGPVPASDVYEITASLNTGLIGAVRLETLPSNSYPLQSAARAADGRFRLSEIEAELVGAGAEVQADGDKPEKPRKLRFAQSGSDSAETDRDSAKAIDGNPDSGWSVATNSVSQSHFAVFVLDAPATISSNAILRVRLRFESDKTNRALGSFRLAIAQRQDLVRTLIPPKQESWHVIGPFKTEGLQAGFAKAYAPEMEVDLKKSYPGVREEIRWNSRPEIQDGKSHLLVHDLHGVHGAYYFHRKIQLPEERDVELRLRANDLFKVWVNGRLVHERASPAKSGDPADLMKLKLPKGENRLLIKVINHQGSAYFAFDKDLGDRDILPTEITPILAATPTPANVDVGRVREHYRRTHSDEFKQLFTRLDEHRSEQKSLERIIPTTLVAREMEKPRETFMLVRGEYDKPGDKVSPGVPAILPPWPADAPTNRLGLAKWLLSPEHPLTARVNVNRFWQQFFGTGLVKTTEDFGVQGERPSHPELLDWLAAEFVRSGWDVKKLHRLIVTSATYRQSSQVSPELLARDPENRLLARGPRFRVEGEVLRDIALYVGGILAEKQGGRSVKPYEPPGLWETVSFNNSQKYVPDTGESQYRRGLYTYWKRQSPPPNMLIFDAPTREYCVVRRPRTNTPLQALALLNDPQFVEASRAFAFRILVHGGKTVESRITYAFRTATSRKPGAQEIRILKQTLEQQLAEYRRDSVAAEKLISVGGFKGESALDEREWAAWATIASMILNLDEAVTKG